MGPSLSTAVTKIEPTRRDRILQSLFDLSPAPWLSIDVRASPTTTGFIYTPALIVHKAQGGVAVCAGYSESGTAEAVAQLTGKIQKR